MAWNKRKKAVALLLALLLLFSGTPVYASEQVASDDERASQTAVGDEDDTPLYAADIANGSYDNVEVESSSSMFKIVSCMLIVEDDSMTASITLSGTGYLRLYMGTGEEAVTADESAYCEYYENEDGTYSYDIPVEALDATLECTGFSKRKEKWYDHQISVRSSSLPADAIASTEIVEQQKLDAADGEYTTEVSMTGGSGKASVTSPAKIVVADGYATATVEWSSPNYDYMIVNGQTYYPVNTEGNSVFEIPVLCVDEPMTVIGDTTAMSQPHEITYELTFSGNLKKQGGSPMTWIWLPIALCAVLIVVVVLRRKK